MQRRGPGGGTNHADPYTRNMNSENGELKNRIE